MPITAKIISAVLSLSVLSFPTPSETPATGSREAITNAIVHVAKAATGNDEDQKPKNVMKMTVTAYSSTPEETKEDDPFTTASGIHVRDGIVATNMLPFHTKVMIPKFFGNKVFAVEDRMARRKVGFIDIWMPTKKDALKFGIAETDVIILN